MICSKVWRAVSPILTLNRLCVYQSAKFSSSKSPAFSNELKIIDPTERPSYEVYKVLGTNGTIEGDESYFAQVDNETNIRMYKTMVTLNEMDKVMYESQRQGRISFYMTSSGEEGSHVGSAAALDPEDLVYAQYRETGVLMWRGFSVEQMIDQLYGNIGSSDKGKQMPVHYGSRQHHFVTISSPLATQLPQAVGSAYAYKLKKNEKVVIVYFGEGAASEGDAFSALNFASTLDCPVIFFCRNNGYAISTPASEQYGGDGIAARGFGLGISAIRVDGNDVCAVYNATKKAREYVLSKNRPLILEAMTYRIGHHSTSDDSTAYRSKSEVQEYEINNNPILRFKTLLFKKKLWSEEQDEQLKKESKQLVLDSIRISEKKLKPSWKEMFEDVYHEMPPHIRDQMKEVEDHLKIYKDHYPLKNHA
ncbi:hypothetical protein M8J76_003241 [Diaphorina citri]|nr:hypothetical protein M8J76_003241 [Diaphorina citri]